MSEYRLMVVDAANTRNKITACWNPSADKIPELYRITPCDCECCDRKNKGRTLDLTVDFRRGVTEADLLEIARDHLISREHLQYAQEISDALKHVEGALMCLKAYNENRRMHKIVVTD